MIIELCFAVSKSLSTLRKDLLEAIKTEDKDALENLIKECENAAYPELGFDLIKARDTLESLGGERRG